MTDAPQCPEGCGPFGIPLVPDAANQLCCAACGGNWEDHDDWEQAVKSQDEFLELEGVEDAKKREAERSARDQQALVDWNRWAAALDTGGRR